MNKCINASDIATFLNVALIGEELPIYRVSSINSLSEHSLSFISKYGYIEDKSKRSLIIVDKNYEIDTSSTNSYIKVENSRLAFAQTVEQFFYEQKNPSISEKSIIHESVILGKNIYIGNNVVIESGVIIGDNTIVEHNVVILKNCIIGSNCKIAPGVVIGDDGLGSLRDKNNNLIMLRHIGKVVIRDYVEIGANSTIARGTIDDTIINNHTKIGPQTNIGHNTIIDENTEIAGRTHTSGSVKIGKNCFIGANCSIKESIQIGHNCTVGIGAVVTKNIEDNITVMGLEAIKLKSLGRFKKDHNYN